MPSAAPARATRSWWRGIDGRGTCAAGHTGCMIRRSSWPLPGMFTPGPRLDSLRDLVVRPVAGSYPVVASEFGEKDCARDWVEDFMSWADDAGISYLAWTWDTWP